MINLKNISHSYDDKQVLDNLSLEIELNKLTCLLGGSGSGKTTILRIIAGLENPQLGEVSINSKVLTSNNNIIIPPNERKLGFIFQDLALWPHLSVFDNIAFGLIERKENNIKEKVYEILDYFNLKELSVKFPNQLSGGQKQLVAISRSLVLKPDVLLMDEPLNNLDVKLKRRILDYIKNLKHEFNLTIVYVTHDHKEAFAVSDKIVILDKGKIEEIGTIEQIKQSSNEFVNYFLEY